MDASSSRHAHEHNPTEAHVVDVLCELLALRIPANYLVWGTSSVPPAQQKRPIIVSAILIAAPTPTKTTCLEICTESQAESMGDLQWDRHMRARALIEEGSIHKRFVGK